MYFGKIKKSYKLKVLISVTTLIILVFYTLFTLLISYYISRDSIFMQLEENLKHKEKIVQLLIDESHGTLKRNIEIINNSITFSSGQNADELATLEKALNTIIHDVDTIDLAIILDQESKIVLYTQTGILDYTETIKFIQTKTLEELQSSPYLWFKEDGLLFIQESKQLIDNKTGKLTGHILLLYGINNNRQLINDIEEETHSTRVLLYTDSKIIVKSTGVERIVRVKDKITVENDRVIGIETITGELEIERLNKEQTLKLQIDLDENAINHLRNQYSLQFLSLLGIVLITVLIMFSILSKVFKRIFDGINVYTSKVVSGHMDATFDKSNIDEIDFIGSQIEVLANSMITINNSLKIEIGNRKKTEADLRDINVNLEKIVAKRTENLESSNKRLSLSLDEVEAVKSELEVMNDELQHSVVKLVETQTELVESEKMAAIGNIVIGISHKFNTPLGVSLTASTYALTLIDKIKRLIVQEEADLEILKAVKSTKEVTEQIVDSVKTLCIMVDELKLISSSDGQRNITTFNLNDFLKKSLIQIIEWDSNHSYHYTIDCDDNIMISSYTDVLYQVIRHLLSNAVRHGFDSSEKNSIAIDVNSIGDEVEILIKDNGLGIPESDVSKIFEPYFTTQLGKGKGGLGLYQDYYLVRDILKGSIACESELGESTTFIITLNK